MQVFNVGLLEVLFILVLAFILMGPVKTVQASRRIGEKIRNLVKSPIWREIRTASREIKNIPKKVMDDAELQKLINDLDLSTQDVKQEISQTQKDVEGQLSNMESEIDEYWKTHSVGEKVKTPVKCEKEHSEIS